MTCFDSTAFWIQHLNISPLKLTLIRRIFEATKALYALDVLLRRMDLKSRRVLKIKPPKAVIANSTTQSEERPSLAKKYHSHKCLHFIALPRGLGVFVVNVIKDHLVLLFNSYIVVTPWSELSCSCCSRYQTHNSYPNSALTVGWGLRRCIRMLVD